MTALKAELLTERLPQGDVEVDGVGTVRVRGLSRAELLELRKLDDTAAWERRVIHLCTVDPKLSEDEAEQWRAAAGHGEIMKVIDRIDALSGLREDAAKAAYKSDGDESGA